MLLDIITFGGDERIDIMKPLSGWNGYYVWYSRKDALKVKLILLMIIIMLWIPFLFDILPILSLSNEELTFNSKLSTVLFALISVVAIVLSVLTIFIVSGASPML